LQHSDYITRANSELVIDEGDIDRLINQVHKLVMLPGEEIIHVLPQEFKVDGQAEVKEPIGMYGGRLEANFHVVVGQVSSIRNIGRCVKSSGLQLEGITLEPLASANAVLSREEKEAGVALIDIGGGTTDLAVFKDGIIRHTAVIPFGGNVITEDIKEGCSIIEKQAELLKMKFGSAWPGENKDNEIVSIPGLRGREPKEITLKNLSKIIHARVVEIIEQVYVEIKNYGHEEQKKKLIAGIVLTGGGSQLKHLKQLVEYITGMDTRIGYPNEHLAGDSDEDIASPLFATAVGLVMDGLKRQERKHAEELEEEMALVSEQEQSNDAEAEAVIEEPKKERRSFLDKLTERVKEFLDNAE
jgi:cell division protein FtsA